MAPWGRISAIACAICWRVHSDDAEQARASWVTLPPRLPICIRRRTSYVHRRSLVQERHHLLPRCREIPGRERRWHRRFRGLEPPARLPVGPGRHLRLAAAVLSIAQPRQRLRRLGLLRRARAARVAGRLRQLRPARRCPRHPRHRRPRRQPHVHRLAVVPEGAPRPEVERSATGTCGPTSGRRTTKRESSSLASRRRRGRSTSGRPATTSTASTSTRPT